MTANINIFERINRWIVGFKTMCVSLNKFISRTDLVKHPPSKNKTTKHSLSYILSLYIPYAFLSVNTCHTCFPLFYLLKLKHAFLIFHLIVNSKMRLMILYLLTLIKIVYVVLYHSYLNTALSTLLKIV